MHVLAVVGPSDAGKTTLVERLTAHLAERGPVATVKHLSCEPTLDTAGTDTARHRAAGAETTVGVGADGEWFATGARTTLASTLDDLAPDHEYAIVEGYADSSLPKVVLTGEPSPEGEATSGPGASEPAPAAVDASEPVIARASGPDAVDVEDVLEQLESHQPRVTLQTLIDRATGHEDAERAGALATFTGRVRRRDDPDDVPTEYLEYERYDDVAEERTASLLDDLRSRDGVFEVLVHHRTGVVPAEEDAVYVVVLAGHRAEAFATVEDAIDRLKSEVPLFKKEVTVEGEFWGHERDAE